MGKQYTGFVSALDYLKYINYCLLCDEYKIEPMKFEEWRKDDN